MPHPIKALPVDLIRPGASQARRVFDPAMLAELSKSIAESGVIQPVVVRSLPLTGDYELLAGERRWRATQLAGLHEIPAIVRDDLSDDEATVLGLIENLQRESLNPMETAAGLEYLTREHGLTHEQAAQKIGKSRAYVSNFLRLLTLDRRVADLVNQSKLSMGHARALAGAPQPKQLELALESIKGNLSVRALEARLRKLDGSAPRAVGATPDRYLANIERQLADHLGNPVRLSWEPGGRGSLTIEFHSLDAFDGVCERMGFRAE